MARLLAERAFVPPNNILEEDLSPHHVPYPARDAGSCERDREARSPVGLEDELPKQLFWARYPTA